MKILKAISILVVLSGISCFTFAADSPKYLADRHVAKQIPCEACHGKGTPNDQIQMDNCLKCHGGTYEKLAAQTDGGDINYHDTHMGQINSRFQYQNDKAEALSPRQI